MTPDELDARFEDIKLKVAKKKKAEAEAALFCLVPVALAALVSLGVLGLLAYKFLAWLVP